MEYLLTNRKPKENYWDIRYWRYKDPQYRMPHWKLGDTGLVASGHPIVNFSAVNYLTPEEYFAELL